MKAYTTTITKREFVKELKAHQKADNFVRGNYFSIAKGKGCAIGCSLESISRAKGLKFEFDDHTLYPTHLGIPTWLAHVEDFLFERMSEKRSKKWPVEFAQAISEGADLEKIRIPFLIAILELSLISLDGVKFDAVKFPDVAKAVEGSKEAVRGMIQAHKSGNALTAARSAESAAESAARSAAESAARSAARSAAWSARSAAWSARSAAWSAESAAYEKLASVLIKLLKACS